MEMKFKRIFFLFFLLPFILASLAYDTHPHGHGENIVEIVRKGEHAEFCGNTKFITETFTHPEVKDRKIVVFAIIGAYREGKSFLLDYCLRYLYATYPSVDTKTLKNSDKNWMGNKDEPLTGFSWKHGATADTKGFMMWSDVFLYDAPDGEKIAIVVMDTQGLFEKSSTDEENAKLFSFSNLVSSIQIVNIKEKIQENQIAHLQTAIELTQLINNKHKNSHTKLFQNLTFLLRDFADDNYGLGYKGGQKYVDDFFEAAPNSIANHGTKAEVNRNSIRGSFEHISCFLLPHPGLRVKESNFKGQWGMLESPFREQLEVLIESLLLPKNLVKKSVFGKEITAGEFMNFLTAYLKAYGTYDMPKVESIFQIAIDTQMGAIVKLEVIKYDEALKSEEIDFTREDFEQRLQQMHQRNKQKAIDNFERAEKVEDEASAKKFKILLENLIEEIFEISLKFKRQSYESFKTEEELKQSIKIRDYVIIAGLSMTIGAKFTPSKEVLKSVVGFIWKNVPNIFLKYKTLAASDPVLASAITSAISNFMKKIIL